MPHLEQTAHAGRLIQWYDTGACKALLTWAALRFSVHPENIALGLALLVLASTFGLSYGFSKRIARPIRQLKEGTELIAQGNL